MKIFIIAGEASGDQLGASIVESLRTHALELNLRGIGGDNLKAAGLSETLFPMHDLSIMGVAEILPHIPKLLKRIDQTVTAIKLFNPDVILTIDSPDFCFRVLNKLNRTKIKSKKIHVVAPSVWAWRPERAKKIAKFLDGLLCLLPFEPTYFEKEGLKSEFMGHPVMQSSATTANGNAFRFRHMIGATETTCGIFLGSRTGELDRHQEVFLDAAALIQEQIPDIIFIAPTLPRFAERLQNAFRARGLKAIIVDNKDEKFEAIAACNVAINVSGTIGLELSVAKIPHIMAYKFHPISYAIGRAMVETKFGHLTNIILNDEIVPEFLQNSVTAETLSTAILLLLNDQTARQKQIGAFEIVRAQLSPAAQKKSADIAADFINSFIKE